MHVHAGVDVVRLLPDAVVALLPVYRRPCAPRGAASGETAGAVVEVAVSALGSRSGLGRRRSSPVPVQSVTPYSSSSRFVIPPALRWHRSVLRHVVR